MTNYADLIAELREFAEVNSTPPASLMRDAADAIQALLGEPEWEYDVKTHYAPLGRTYYAGPTDLETARAIMADTPAGFTRTLQRRRKPDEWEEVTM